MIFAVNHRQRAASAIVLAVVALGSAGQADRLPLDTRISLERTRCFGECPAYSVSVDATGTITYVGEDLVRVTGGASARIPARRVSDLLERARAIGFFDLRDEYKADITDLPTTVVTITSNGRSKRVVDYVGAPRELRAFEHDIDQALGTQRWVRIDTATLQQLIGTGWSPSAAEGAELLRKAVDADDVDVVKALLDFGVDPNSEYYHDKTTPLMLVRSATAAYALIAAGANPLATNIYDQTPLRSAALAAPEVTAVLLKAGSPVAAMTDALWHAACAGNSGVVALLIEARADVKATQNGVTPADCAKGAKLALATYPPSLSYDDERPFLPDFDKVLALLEQARK